VPENYQTVSRRGILRSSFAASCIGVPSRQDISFRHAVRGEKRPQVVEAVDKYAVWWINLVLCSNSRGQCQVCCWRTDVRQ
jgi:hypothetical protein